MFWFFDYKACVVLAPQPGIKFLLTLGGEVSATGLPEKPLIHPLDLSTNVCEAIFNPLTWIKLVLFLYSRLFVSVF